MDVRKRSQMKGAKSYKVNGVTNFEIAGAEYTNGNMEKVTLQNTMGVNDFSYTLSRSEAINLFEILCKELKYRYSI